MARAAVGFVGIGNMGAPMARCLAKAGHDLVLFDAHPDAAAALAGGKIARAETLRDLGARCAMVITMLPDADIVRTVVMGGEARDALVRGMTHGGVVIDMSSSAPAATQSLGRGLAELGIDLVDAPVSGGVPKARDGTLTIMAGGGAETLDKIEAVLSAMGKVQRTGGLGSGHAMKALNNYVSAAGLLAVCEALIVARRFGLDPEVLNGVLNASTGRNNTTDKKVEQFILNRAFDSGFALELMRKDVGIARDLATGLDLDAPWLQGCAALLDRASKALGPGADHTAAFAYLEDRLSGAARNTEAQDGGDQ